MADFAPNSPALALRRYWLEQQTDADRQTLEQFLTRALTDSSFLRHPISMALADAEVKAHWGVPDCCCNVDAVAAIYRHEPALPLAAYAMALTLDAFHYGEESSNSWAARIPEDDRYDFESEDGADD